MNSDCEKSEHPSIESQVCKQSVSNRMDSIILFAKSGHSQSLPDLELNREIDNLSPSNMSTYYISPIQFKFINLDKFSNFLSSPNDWSGLILTSTRCVDAMIL